MSVSHQDLVPRYHLPSQNQCCRPYKQASNRMINHTLKSVLISIALKSISYQLCPVLLTGQARRQLPFKSKDLQYLPTFNLRRLNFSSNTRDKPPSIQKTRHKQTIWEESQQSVESNNSQPDPETTPLLWQRLHNKALWTIPRIARPDHRIIKIQKSRSTGLSQDKVGTRQHR